MRRLDPKLPERLERIDAWWERTDKIMNILGWAVIVFAPVWWIIKAL